MDIPNNQSDVPAFLRALFKQAVAFADPANCVPPHLPAPPKGRTLIVAAGKAAASMAQAAQSHWPEGRQISGFALTRYGHGLSCHNIEVIEASHPVPDDRGYKAALKLMQEVEDLTSDDLLLFLVSGGGSALLALPASPISLDEKKQINKALLMSGAPIGEMNTVRKHLSAIKGGRLARVANPARIVTLAISDVPNDDPSTIASGPTVPDATTSADAIALLERYSIVQPASIRNHLLAATSETPKPGDAIFTNTTFKMVSTPSHMLAQMVDHCEKLGIEVHSFGADLEGESRLVAKDHAKLALELKAKGKKAIILSGGETTVTVGQGVQPGKGGRDCEFLLALAIELNGQEGISALAADTDGIDGSEDNAGAIIVPQTLQRAKDKGLDASEYLARHDSYSFFKTLDDLVMTGPTRTNVNDFRAILIL